MGSRHPNVTMASEQDKIISAQNAEKKAFESLPKDFKDLDEANPAPKIIQRLWTRPDLIKQFKEEADYTEFKLTIAEKLIGKAITTAINGGAEATGLLEAAHEFIVDKVQNDIAADVVGLVPQTKLESKAATKAVRSFGTHFILMSVSLALHANPGTAPVAMLFTLILYMHQKEKERQAKWDTELATILDEKLEIIRAKKQQGLDVKHARQLESFLLSDMASTISDETALGSYVNKKRQVIELSIGDAAQLATYVDGQYSSLVRPQSLLRACAWLGLELRRDTTLKITDQPRFGLNAYFGWLKQHIKDELDAEYNSSLEEEPVVNAPKVNETIKGGSRK